MVASPAIAGAAADDNVGGAGRCGWRQLSEPDRIVAGRNGIVLGWSIAASTSPIDRTTIGGRRRSDEYTDDLSVPDRNAARLLHCSICRQRNDTYYGRSAVCSDRVRVATAE